MGYPLPEARAGRVDDLVLDAVRRAWTEAMRGDVTDEGAQLLKITVGPLLTELADYRQRAADSLELDPPTNVIPLPRDGA